MEDQRVGSAATLGRLVAYIIARLFGMGIFNRVRRRLGSACGPREASEVARVESPSWALSNKRPELGGNGRFAAGRHIRWRCEVAGNVLRMHRFSLIMIVAGDR